MAGGKGRGQKMNWEGRIEKRGVERERERARDTMGSHHIDFKMVRAEIVQRKEQTYVYTSKCPPPSPRVVPIGEVEEVGRSRETEYYLQALDSNPKKTVKR